MDIDQSEEISLSPGASRTSMYNSSGSSMSQEKGQAKDASDSDRYSDSKLELEEGEIDSDVSSTHEQSPRRDEGKDIFKQKTHKQYSSDSDTSDGSPAVSNSSKGNNSAGTESLGGKISIDIKLSHVGKEDSPMSDDDDDDDYQEVQMVSSSDDEVSRDEKVSRNAEDGESYNDVDAEEDSSESSDEESIEREQSRFERNSKKQKETQNESDVESSASEESISVHSVRSSSGDNTKRKKDAVAVVKSDSESDSEIEDNIEQASQEDKTKSLSFKKRNQSREKDSKGGSASQKHSDNDSDNDVIDHLEIAAPQQALLRETKKKNSKEKSRSERSSIKDEKQRSKNRDKKEDVRHREREKREKSKEYHDKKSGKYKERRYDSHEYKTSSEPMKRSRSPIEKKSQSLVEEDLRRKLLQKRSTRDVSSRGNDQRDHRDKYRRDEKNSHKEKTEKRRDETIVKSRKEEREKALAFNVKKSSKSQKENSDIKKNSKEKSPKGTSTDNSKKRRREKTKSEIKKKKPASDDESSEDDDDKEDAKRPATKRPRSADQGNEVINEDKHVADDKTEAENDIDKDYSYDDISPASSEELSPPPSPVELKKPTYYPAIMGCRDVIKEFQWLNKIEEGTYGVVYRARDNRTDEIVALKRLKMEKEKEGFPITSLREINTLLKAQHPNIVTVREIVVGSNMDKIYIVMDYVEHDLKALMETMTQPFLVGEVKTLMIQLLRGVQHMHDNWILHRDIKASNLLLSHKGILKIGDFGLAREYGSPLKQYTTVVVTLWYRAPELLLGGKQYATAIDLWSVGCVFAELLTMKPLFPGKSEIDQINRIFKELGTPNDKIWPGPPLYSEYPLVKKTNFANHPYNILRQKFGATLTDKGFHLLNRLLTYDPNKRITADAALEHEFFEESPLPVDPSMFPTWPAKSELGHRAVRKHNASPKAPEGGAAASKVANEDSHTGFHMPAATKGYSAKGAGFNLKF